MSLVIWGHQALAATVLAFTYAGFTKTSGIVVLAERVFEGPVGALQGAVGAWSSLCLLSLALVWPVAMWIYLPRVKNEPLRAQNRTGVL
jgi:hypothetical protein